MHCRTAVSAAAGATRDPWRRNGWAKSDYRAGDKRWAYRIIIVVALGAVAATPIGTPILTTMPPTVF